MTACLARMQGWRVLGLLATAWLHTAPALSANLTVQVSGAQGQSLQDAVVMLEPAMGRLPVRPMPAIEVEQVDRQFNPQLVVVTVGTAVSFPNHDKVRHQIFSFSPIKPFETPLASPGPGVPMVFDKPGVATVGCNIHDRMLAWVVVVDTPYHARTAANGQARIAGIAPGNYRLHAWHASVSPGQEPAPVELSFGSADASVSLSLPTSAP